MNKSLLKLTILSPSLLLMLTPTVAVTMPMLAQQFPDAGAQLGLSMTLPSLGILIFALLSNRIAKFIGDKQTILLGLTIALVSGIAPAFVASLPFLLITRFLLGVGIGIAYPYAYSLISQYFTGKEAQQVFGFQGATQAAGYTIFVLVAGQLAGISWQSAYWVYAVAIVPLLLVLIYLPNKTAQAAHNVSPSSTSNKISLKQLTHSGTGFFLVFLFAMFVLYMAFPINGTTLITDEAYNMQGTVTQASILLAIQTAASTLAGLLYGWILSQLKRFTLPMALVLIALGFLIAAIATNFGMMLLAVILTGTGFSIVPAYIIGTATGLAPKGTEGFISSLVVVAINLGGFLSPYLVTFLSSNLSTQFMAIAALNVLLAFIAVVLTTKYRLQ